jgi:serine/threonine-protein kinase
MSPPVDGTTTHDGPPSPEEGIGRLGERFLLLELLGRGAMGTVYRARDLSRDGEFALKVSRVGREARLLREGQLGQRLDHPGLVTVHDVGEIAQSAFVLYELIQGAQPLERLLPQLSRRQALSYVQDAARALGYAHAHGVVHRDVKPANLLVDAEGRLRVSDFGLARASDLPPLTEPGAAVGTLPYMAPEQLVQARGSLGPPTDVWALGVILYRILSGQLPHSGTSPAELLQAARQPPSFDGPLEPVHRVCLQAMSFEPEARYPHAGALADALTPCLQTEPAGRPWPQTASQDSTHARIGPYQVLAEIARGGMGKVVRARDPELGREVAIKFPLQGHQLSPRARQRFLTECEALARLRHPNIVAVHSAGEHQGAPYMVLPLLEGVTLEEQLILGGPLRPPVAVEVARKLALALGHTHARSLLHRDVKPSNVIMTADLEAEANALSRAGAFMGTPGYCPPEQARGDLERIGPRSDVFGLGATLYAALTGHAPFEGASLIEVLSMEDPPAPPSSYVPGLDRRLDALVLGCLKRDPDDRPASAGELAAQLEGYLEEPMASRLPAVLAAAAIALGLMLAAVVVVSRTPGAASVSPDPAPATSPSPVAVDADPHATLEQLVDTWLAGPEEPAGLAARLALTARLREQDGAHAARLAQEELDALVAAGGVTAARARLQLALRQGDALAWPALAALLERLDGQDLGAQATSLGPLRALATALASAEQPPLTHERAAAYRSRGAPGLALARDGRVWTVSLAPESPSLLVEGERWSLPPGEEVWRLATGDRDGDGTDEVHVVAQRSARAQRVGFFSTQSPGLQGVFPTSNRSIVGLACGDLNADGLADLAVAYFDGVAVSLGGDDPRPVEVHEEARQYAISRVLFADLNGDGRDELLVGGNENSRHGLEVFTYDAASRAFQLVNKTPVGNVSELLRYPLPGDREGVMVVVDHSPSSRLVRGMIPAEQPAWVGRDGVYVFEDRGDGPERVGRWTFGPDELPDKDSPGLASDVVGVVLRLDDALWVARQAFLREQGWRLELTPLADLALDANVPPTLRLFPSRPPFPDEPETQLVVDLDQDGDEELLAGATLLGVGPPRVTPPPASPPPGARHLAEHTARAVRFATLLGDDALAGRLIQRLRASSPPAAQAAVGELAEVQREQAAVARRHAADAFETGAFEGAYRLWNDAERLNQAAAGSWEQLATSAETDPERAEAWLQAALAWDDAHDPTAARQALEKAVFAAPDDAVLRARLDAVSRYEKQETLALLGPGVQPPPTLRARWPLRTRLSPEGALRLRCDPDVIDWALTRVDLGAPLPRTLEAVVRTTGSSWTTVASVGFFETPDPQSGKVPSQGSFNFQLWDSNALDRFWIKGLAKVWFREYHHRMRLRVSQRELGDGTIRTSVLVMHDSGWLLYARERDDLPAPTEAQVEVGASSPLYGILPDAALVPNLFGRGVDLVVEELRVSGTRPRLLPPQLSLQEAHGALVRGDAELAIEGYERILATQAKPEALFFRGLARGRLGDAEASEDLVLATERAPYRAAHWLEDLASVLPESELNDLTTVHMALRILSTREQPLRLLARELGGEHVTKTEVSAAFTDGGEEETAWVYLALRRAGKDRSLHQRYAERAPGERLPRSLYPPVLNVPIRGFYSEKDYKALIKELDELVADTSTGQCRRCKHRLLYHARAARPADPVPHLLLGVLHHQRGLTGLAEASFRRAVELAAPNSREARSAYVRLATVLVNGRRFNPAMSALKAGVKAGLSRERLLEFEPQLGQRKDFRELVEKAD